jgi:biopolymer transport protein ExbD
MAASMQSDGDDIISGINVTPLVDIVLVVLIIFIVTASFVLRHNFPVDLPEAKTAEASTAGLINIAVTEDGQIFLNGKPGELGQIDALVQEAKAKIEKEGGKVSAFISADVGAKYGAFAEVLDRLRLSGVVDIALDTQPVKREDIGS